MPYIGEVRLFAGNFPPRGWAFCNGQILSVDAFPRVFSVLGASFGGDGIETFALPDLRGRVPVHLSDSVELGQEGGSEVAMLDSDQMPEHLHSIVVSQEAAVESSPVGRVFATGTMNGKGGGSRTHMISTRTSRAGAGNAHENMQPYLCLNYIIAIEGRAVTSGGGQS